MASALDQLIRPGERVVYRTRRPWPPRYRRGHGLAILVFGLGLFAVNKWAAFDWSVLATPPAITVIIAAFLISVGAFLERLMTEVAVTDQRVLRVDTTEKNLQFRSVELTEIGEIEVLRQAVRVTTTGGEVVAFKHVQYAPEIALAAAQAAGRPPPWVPGPKGSIATQIADNAGVAAGVSAFLLQAWALRALGLTPIESPWLLLILVPVMGIAAAAWLAAEPLGLIALRPSHDVAEVQAWVRYHILVEQDGSKPDNYRRIRRLRLRYFNLVADLLYGRPPAPADDGAEPNGH